LALRNAICCCLVIFAPLSPEKFRACRTRLSGITRNAPRCAKKHATETSSSSSNRDPHSRSCGSSCAGRACKWNWWLSSLTSFRTQRRSCGHLNLGNPPFRDHSMGNLRIVPFCSPIALMLGWLPATSGISHSFSRKARTICDYFLAIVGISAMLWA
jgi:hypothetical protein